MEIVRIPFGGVAFTGDLALPVPATGVVIFAHGSGSSRHSPRNQFVAAELQRAGFGTLLLDLLTPAEEQADSATGNLRFDIQLLATRLSAATDWMHDEMERRGRRLPIGYFGASTGAAAAIEAAASRPQLIRAIVARGGRPDLAGGAALAHVQAPTLLIVGGADATVIDLNAAALRCLRVETELVIVPHASHLFEEPGTLERVAELAGQWFTRYLRAVPERAMAV